MLTGLEAAVLKAAQTASAKALGPATSAASRASARHRLRSSIHVPISAREVDEAGDALIPEQAHQIAAYVRSPEFEELAFQLALSAATDSSRGESGVLDRVRVQMLEHLSSQTDLDDEDRTEVADLILDALNQAVAVHVTRTVDSVRVQGNIFTRHVVSAAALAAAQVRNTELMAGIGELSGIFDFSEELRRHVRRSHARIEILHLGPRTLVPYAQLWVKPSLSLARSVVAASRPPATTADLAEQPHLQPLIGPENLAQIPRCVVLGDPGAGKSTLARWLSYAISGDEIPDFAGRVPLVLVLREHIAELTNGSLSLPDHIARTCHGKYHVDPPAHAVEYLLRNGRGVVILDGLDELPSTALRHSANTLIEHFSTAYPTTPIIVTARRVGYDEAALDADSFVTLSLAPFNDNQVTEYVTKWFARDGEQSAAEADPATPLAPEPRTAAFMRESSAVSDLRSNPLLLSLLCALYQWEGYLPENRPKVYEECTRLLIERWDGIRGVKGKTVPLRQSLAGILADIAWWMWSVPSESGTVATRRALEGRIADYLARTRFVENRDLADHVAREFVDFCSDRAWILSQVGTFRGDETYAFTHRTFLEYYAALHLVRANRDTDELLSAIVNEITSTSSAIVAELAVHESDARTGSASDLLDRLLDLHQSEPPDKRLSMISFAARCLIFTNPRETTIRRIVEAATDLAIEGIGAEGSVATVESYAVPLSLLLSESSLENRTLIRVQFTQYMKKRLHQDYLESPEARNHLISLAAALSRSPRRTRVFGRYPAVSRSDVLPWTFVEPTLMQLAPSQLWASARLALEGELAVAEAHALHGNAVLFCAPTPRLTAFGEVFRSAALQLAINDSNDLDLDIGEPAMLIDRLLASSHHGPWVKIVMLVDQLEPFRAMGGDRFFDTLLAREAPDPDLFSLGLLVGLPFTEMWMDARHARWGTARVSDVTAPGWLDRFAPLQPAAPVALLVNDLIQHGLRESCREFVTDWMNGDVHLVDWSEEGESR